MEASPEQTRPDGHALKSALPRTWGAFFRRHGNFTPAQLAAIPPILAGENVILCAPTASGKTEAALAPLVERYLPAERVTSGLTILYLLPTRALISDLWARIHVPLETLRVSCAVKTHDFNTLDPERPADLLLTTPESLDALMSNQTKLLAGARAVVLDELHTFDGTVRGDQLRVLLNRLRDVRAHAAKAGDAGDTTDAHVQVVALSATLAEPTTAAGRYFGNARVVEVQTHGEQGNQGNSTRAIEAELIALEVDTVGALLDYLSTFRARGWRKALAFCNTRAEVERYTAAIRNARNGGSPFGEAVYVHYSNLGWERRREIEHEFAQAEAALCFASSTLELGIDVGNIDVTLLIGPPGSSHSFVQRVGRANRRRKFARVACFYRTPLERITFGALLGATERRPRPEGTRDDRPLSTEVPEAQDATSGFRPSVAVQQIFSVLKQSPTGAVRLNPLSHLFEGMLSVEDLRLLLGTLQALGYLTTGRPGEWRTGERLNRLVDLQAAEYSTLSLHSNIEMGGAPIKIRDRDSQRVVASIDRQWFDGDILTLEGRPLNVEWYDGESLWVSVNRDNRAGETANAAYSTPLRYLSTKQALSYDLAGRLPLQLGLPPGAAPMVPNDGEWLWFHWLGDVYGRAILDLLAYTLPVAPTSQVGLCLLFTDEPRSIPACTPAQVERYLHDRYRTYEPILALGAYHHLVPVDLRRRAVVEQFDVPRFIRAVEGLRMERASEALTEELHLLIAKD